MALPLTLWQLHAKDLPDSWTNGSSARGFVLPGAQALSGFADLLGADEPEAPPQEAAQASSPFSLPAMIPQDVEGPVSLCREIDFGALRGCRAVLTLDHIVGSGRILLGETLLCTFDSARLTADALLHAQAMSAQPCMLAVDLSDALALGRREKLVIELDEARPAGLPGPVLLHVTPQARLDDLCLIPNAREQTVCVRARVHAEHAGRYVLRAQAVSADGTADAAWETPLTLEADETLPAAFSLALVAAPFVPGVPYEAPVIKVQLFSRPEGMTAEGLLCDSASLLCGYGVKAPQAWLPVRRAALIAQPEKVVGAIKTLGVPAISLDEPVPDSVYRRLCRAGIAVRQTMPMEHPLHDRLLRLPCVSLSDPALDDAPSLEQSAWQLCSMTAAPRTLDGTLTARELLAEACGLALDPADSGVRDVLLWLRAVSVRLRAEAARQGRFQGALCGEDEWENDDTAQAIRTAFAPAHLSALPLCGAWWTQTRFSAALQAFFPAEACQKGAQLTARAVLEDADGQPLARFEAPCPARGGYVGVIEAPLPQTPCVLELTCQLLDRGEVVEESTLPVYVGERGPLQAAFSA